MGFIQTIEYSTSRIDEVRQLVDDFRANTEGTRTTARGTVCADRDQANRYVTIVEFPSYEEAMKNSELPETSAFAEAMAKLCDGPPTFRNLDVVETFEG
jgi:quinol monooxygenase YgiN